MCDIASFDSVVPETVSTADCCAQWILVIAIPGLDSQSQD